MDDRKSQDASAAQRTHAAAAAAARPASSPSGSTFDPRDIVPEPLFCCDSDGRLVWMNSAAEQLAGHPSHELLGQTFPILFPFPDRKRISRHIARQHLKGKNEFYCEAPFVTGEGRVHWVGLKVKKVLSGSGKAGYVASAHDLQDVHEELERLKMRERELRASVEETKSASQLKSDFLASMSHEIRNPMNGVIGMSRTLLESTLNEEQRMWTNVILGSGEALLQLVNDILDFSRIEAGKIDLETLDFDLRVAVDQCSSLLAPRAAAQGLAFTAEVKPRVPSRLTGDPGRLRQVVLNLAGAAIKFTERGAVDVVVDLAEETAHQVVLRVSVRQNSAELTAENIDRLFRVFGSGDPAAMKQYGGSGLGLTIARQLVSLMGGEVGVVEEPGRGATLWFMLPLKKQPDEVAPEPRAEADLRGVRVLVADAAVAAREEMKLMLTAWGCEAEEAGDGLQALERLRSAASDGKPVQVALIDMDLPILDPESFSAAMRSEPGLNRTRLMLLTNLGRRGDAARAEDWGYLAYLLKPVQSSQMHEALVQIVSRGDSFGPPPGAKVSTSPRIITRHVIAEQQRQRVRVLLVEDNPVNQLVAVASLRRMGYSPDVVSSGEAALDAVARAPYDIIFMDVNLGELDGLETTRRIRENEADTRHTPIVAMTAHDRSEERRACLDAGMDDYLAKPINLEDMCERVDRWVRRDAAGAVRASGAHDANDAAIAGSAMGMFFEAPAEASAAAHVARQVEPLEVPPTTIEASSVEPLPFGDPGVASAWDTPAVPSEPVVEHWEVEEEPDSNPNWARPEVESPAFEPASLESSIESTTFEAPALGLVPPLELRASDDFASNRSTGEPGASAEAEAVDDSLPDLAASSDDASFRPVDWDAAKESGMHETPVLDTKRLEASSMGNPELKALLVKAFTAQTRPRFEKLTVAATQNDADGVAFEAHALRGMCATVGAARCAQVFETIERLGREGRLEPISYLLQRAEIEVARMEAMFRDGFAAAA
ncbi:MAG: response regulator [Candidatus Eisenbacteria bacterium]|uniref:histidine kinase n=1 Tax=Eiseniibacteriota bacterium TaxID=2212470 RepID=A0A849SKL8_UNCEI|nr:response regulator [Candidatus Eisenbacteria bacterium]